MKAERRNRGVAVLCLTLALGGGGWLMPHPSCFAPGNDLEPFVQEAGVDRCKKITPQPEFDPWTTQPVVSCCTFELV